MNENNNPQNMGAQNYAAPTQGQYTQQSAQGQYAPQQPQYTQQSYAANPNQTAQGQYTQQNAQYNAYAQNPNMQYQPQQNYVAPITPDARENKTLAALSYFGIIFMIFALVANGKSAHVRFHANQAIVLDVVSVVGALIMIIPFLGWAIYGIMNLLIFIFRIMGIVNAAKGKQSELPLVGKYKIISPNVQ